MSKTNPFAGLMAGFRGARAENNKNEDEEARKARRAEEDKQREDEDARRAEEDARRAEEDGLEETGANSGKKAEDDDDQDPEADADDDDDAKAEDDMDDKEKAAFRRGVALGRQRENARASRIFLTAATIGRPDLAATLAFTTRNTSAEAGRLMTAAGAVTPPRGRNLDSRMGQRTEPRPGGDGGRGGKPSFGERAALAVKKAGRG